ncbi:DUF885 domain-containing protein [Pseudoxanthomonas daejeonensis]|uniref:DUF885 domain-containing protein n=1 Tax=Pseudoxanthomonas daejeonensis TaxID=266062 RepID=A0ABQ6Z9H4_9GAMM|nr:DUF885 family protein [Pseudoxanthomonas daejeonensis]KAF1696311.1 DUF885 domain-containing protein [Pseudoxanthomonas daejeonensis]
MSLARFRWLALPVALALVLPPNAAAAKKKTQRPAATSPAKAKAKPAKKVETKAEQLQRLYAGYWDASLKLNPLQATFQGDPRWNDQLPNYLSADFRKRSHDFAADWLAKVEAVGEDGLEGQDLLSYRIFVRNARDALDGERYPGWMLPVSQFNNPATLVAMLGSGSSAQPFKTVKDYDNWLKRGAQVPVLFEQAIANMEEGMARGVVQPRPLMEKVLPQLDALIKPTAEETLFWNPIRNMPADFSEADRARLSADYKQLIEYRLMPSYRRLRGFVATRYLPATRTTAGMGALPDGAAWYAHNARQSTTTDLTPEQIHQIGLDEVARIHDEIRKVMKQVKFRGNMQKFFRFMQQDKRFQFADEDALLAYYRGLESKVMAKVPGQFSLLPKAGFEIRPVEAYRAQSAAGGSYMRPSEDGSRPGVFYVNTYDLPTRKTWDAEDLFLHEAIPGHHFQLALQQELTGLPAFRRFGGETAFTEGWGLYAESLGRDLGLYEDPYSYFGYLQNELWRAIRLVVDTGLHSKGWTREQVIAYMLENSATSQVEAVSETERYMAIPGQALAYKIGELKIMELRRKAQAALGPRFDVRQFHAEVLKDGSVPLDVLEAKVDAWITSQQGAAPQATPG